MSLFDTAKINRRQLNAELMLISVTLFWGATFPIVTMAILACFGSLLFEPVTWPQSWTPSLMTALVITPVFATAYAFWAMTTFQHRTTPTSAALIYTLEPVFAAIFPSGSPAIDSHHWHGSVAP